MTRVLLRAAVAAAVAAGLIAALAFGLRRDPRLLPGAVVGKPAPRFSLVGIDGRRVAMSSLRGRPVLVNFWASWCTECRKEHPLLVQAEEQWGRRVRFVGVVFQDTAANARGFLEDMGQDPAGTYPNLMDPGSRTAIDFGVYGVPETFFVDPRGVIAFKRVGRLTPDVLRAGLRRIAT